MVTNVAKASTTQGKRLQADTIATTDLAIGSEVIDFKNDFFARVFVVFAILCYRHSGKKPAKAPLGITRNHVIDKELFKVKVLEHVLLEKADQLF